MTLRSLTQRHFLQLILIIYTLLASCSHQTVDQENSVNIIPLPNIIKMKNGQCKIQNPKCYMPKEYSGLQNVLKTILPRVTFTENKFDANIVVDVNETLADEGYTLDASSNKIEIRGKSVVGMLHGLQSLRQMLPIDGSITLPQVDIKDQPRFKYRGMHLDVGRHFFEVADIKKYIDILSMYKINNFHWHLTEDQGWRIEIKKYPKLSTVAAYRNETLIGHYSDNPQKFDGKKYGGFYTQEQVKEIVKYASKRNINIIPEIEMPGHAQAAISAYPELGCTGKKINAATKWGVFEDVFCPNEKTFIFLEDVLTEVMELFPSKYIHIGGDECPKTQWEKSAFCQALIKKNNLKDEHGLQSYFIGRIEKFLNSHDRQIIGWDEILDGGLAPNATVMSWRGEEGGIEAARQKHNVIMTPTDYCYLDYYQSKNAKEPLAIGGYLPLKKVYDYNPIPEKLTVEDAKYITGLQGNLWTEYLNSFSKVEYMVLPRMQAIAETGWTNRENKSYESFTKRLNYHFSLWKKLGYNYADKSKEINIKVNAGEGKGVTLALSTNGSTLPLKYAIDNTVTNQSTTYEKEISINKSCTITSSIFEENSTSSIGTIKFNIHKGAGKKISLVKQPSEKYSANGAGSLINGLSGSPNKYGSEWLGFEGNNLEATIDLGELTLVNEIKTRFYNGPGQWIYPPKSVSIYFSQDGKNFNEMPAFLVQPSQNINIDFAVPTANTKTRFIKFIANNHGIIAEGNQGAGHPAWLMVDEIFIN